MSFVGSQWVTIVVEALSALDDVELQTDILLATGIDLRRKPKRNSRKPRTGLTDISRIRNNTARKRLASKIFNK